MYGKIKDYLRQELAEIEAAGLYKRERIIESPQRAEIEVAGRKVLNFCANNYLGLSDNPRLIEAAKKALYTGHIGDGKIFVYSVDKVVKVRTGEEDFAALQDVE